MGFGVVDMADTLLGSGMLIDVGAAPPPPPPPPPAPGPRPTGPEGSLAGIAGPSGNEGSFGLGGRGAAVLGSPGLRTSKALLGPFSTPSREMLVYHAASGRADPMVYPRTVEAVPSAIALSLLGLALLFTTVAVRKLAMR